MGMTYTVLSGGKFVRLWRWKGGMDSTPEEMVACFDGINCNPIYR